MIAADSQIIFDKILYSDNNLRISGVPLAP